MPCGYATEDMIAPANPPVDRSAAASRWLAAAEIALIFTIFFIHAGWPVPEVNEAHYLSKAKHYWNPQWCARDFFCNTADAHQVFYWSFGWLSLWLPLPALAWVGRAFTWLLLAWSWRRLSVAIVPQTLLSVLSAALMVALNFRLHMAGEWIVGGVEAKGFSYVLVLLALEALVRGRWNRTWLLLGAASAFHVLVGGWSTVAAGAAWLLSKSGRPTLASMLPSLAGGAALSLPGLIPAVMLSLHVDPQIAAEANRIYVFERLPHHLLVYSFGTWFVLRFVLLVTAWFLLARLVAGEPLQRIKNFVAGSLVIAAVGLLLTAATWFDPLLAAKVLRYYWFRTSDVMVPVGLALLIVWLIAQSQAANRARAGWLVAGAVLVAGWHLGDTVIGRALLQQQNQFGPQADARLPNLADWQAICAWVADPENIPPNALFITPLNAQTFRWYAERAEVICRKDIPQDANGIVEWWRRVKDLQRAFDIGTARVEQLGRKYGAQYAIGPTQPRLSLPRIGPPNPSYAIYVLSPDPPHAVFPSP